jgi:two-component system, chemotaxis family, CheB/CheR fusion protein
MKKRREQERRESTKVVTAHDRRSVRPASPVVGIGASAGGLEALEQFLKHVPAESRASFVIVQHLDPTHEGMLAGLLQRASALPVHQVTDRMRAEPGHVYVIPPNQDMSIVHGVLHLLVPVAPRGLRLPIDFFFRSLAADLRSRSVGVLLSGMGADGTLGLRAIQEKAGSTFVQSPASARYDSMPRSAVEAGVVDVVASAEELPGKIVEYLRHARRVARPKGSAPGREAQSGLDKIVGLLRSATGHDFSLYKTTTLYRRIERRMGLHQIDGMASYIRYLRENPAEGELLFRELLIGVTAFFRDSAEWERVGRDVLPELLARCAPNDTLRAWVPACSTGEEAYSLGMVFKEALEQYTPAKNVRLQIFATDLESGAVEKARQGHYPVNIAADVSQERLIRFFVEEDGGYRVRKEIRELVVFATQNILRDPPFTKLDLLTCRNLLIYLTPEVQRNLIPLFHYSLVPGGVLFLGSAETIGTFKDLFEPLDGAPSLYRRLDAVAGTTALLDSTFPRSVRGASESRPPKPRAGAARTSDLQEVVERALLARFAPAAVLASAKGDVLYVSGQTGKYLELPVGRINWNLFPMARDGLRHALRGAFRKALASKSPVTLTGIRIGAHGGSQTVDVTVEPVDAPGAPTDAMMVVFSDGAATRARNAPATKGGRALRGAAEIAHVEQELQHAREELRTTREEMQTSAEELKSVNEEQQSSNEELQSTNEELTTSKEEMQSMNEELQTVNHELQAKVDELSRASNDMRNLLDSTEIAILFLDDALNVRRFTPQVTTIFKLIPSDVGRPLADLVSDLAYPEIYDDAREVLRTLVIKEKVAASLDGRRLRVRIMPYRTSDNRIDGVVITFTNVGAIEMQSAKVSTE